MNWANILETLLGGGVLVALITSWANRKKVGAEAQQAHAAADENNAKANDILSKAAIALVEPLTKRIEALETQLKTMAQESVSKDCRITGLETDLRTLRAQVEKLQCEGSKKDERIRDLENQLSEKDSAIMGLVARVQELEAEITLLRRENAVATGEDPGV
jgi:predicted RNase H-like nuclease (RuvC/YqgF family)